LSDAACVVAPPPFSVWAPDPKAASSAILTTEKSAEETVTAAATLGLFRIAEYVDTILFLLFLAADHGSAS
jgi:hypothetical protein